LFWCCTFAFGQISPGPLSQAHQGLEGVTKCNLCHGLGGGTLGFKCLECHTEIQRRVSAHTGYHARAYKASPTEADCARCHLEHNGAKFSLIRLQRKDFNHAAQTGFALEGRHAQQNCESCHSAKRIATDARREIKVKNLDHSFLGLRRNCAGCHNEPHGGQLGTECTTCHSQVEWKPTPGFNHARTKFPLTGSHQAVACQNCHGPKPTEQAARYKGLAFNGCQNCHSDPHRGAFQEAKFKGACDACHTTSGWKNNRPSQNFNHEGTAFPLRGKHSAVTCGQCHKDADFHRPVAHARCQDCHQDQHKGQFAARAAGSDCAACHNENGFKPSLFTRQSHQNSVFPLEGKHAALECAQCHQPGGKESVYALHKSQCADCHADSHQGEFAGPPYNNRCEACHTPAAFKPATFSSDRHTMTRFPLEGAHKSVECYDCHKTLPPGPPTTSAITASVIAAVAALPVSAVTRLAPAPNGSSAARRYHFESLACTTCHKDPHNTASGYQQTCVNCHAAQTWNNVRPFNHAETKFPLEGSHKNVACVACHKPTPAGGGADAKNAPGFSKLSPNCFGCHQDPHGGQFRASAPEKDCSACHVVAQWKAQDLKQSGFNHDTTRFPLDRAHQNVACARCHTEQAQADGKVIRKYRGTPIECTQCH